MTTDKKELAVAALRNGTVIDRIPSSALFKAVELLGIANMSTHVTIGNNLESKKIGRKGIIKIADVEFPETVLNRIALIAPSAVVNTIQDFNVTSKRSVVLPDTISGIVRCDNPKCISNNEPMETKFHVVSNCPVTIRCHYCNHTIEGDKAQIL
ncbi:MAG: aspartate carbamoyltransferase regulatory subunit [Muribaculaceae bacterium]|nr:aspartate carbamoyltransferase regulatory subunit [Muribaculaceae bacterium]MDE6331597.1 aspartate carbamoyltransferase regulatory subunit [Muribaculaceae bacterium]